jgi:hypothetical protein
MALKGNLLIQFDNLMIQIDSTGYWQTGIFAKELYIDDCHETACHIPKLIMPRPDSGMYTGSSSHPSL